MARPALNIDQVCREHDLVIQSIGFRDGEVRVVLVAKSEAACPFYVLELREVRSLGAYCGAEFPVRICVGDVGCFGWWLRDKSAYRQITIQSKSAAHHVLLVAIAGKMRFRKAYLNGGDFCFPA